MQGKGGNITISGGSMSLGPGCEISAGHGGRVIVNGHEIPGAWLGPDGPGISVVGGDLFVGGERRDWPTS